MLIGMPPRESPKGYYSTLAKIQIVFDWSKAGGRLENVWFWFGFLILILQFNNLLLRIFNFWYVYLTFDFKS